MSKTILAIDPGYERSAWVLYQTETRSVVDKRIADNDDFMYWIRHSPEAGQVFTIVVEMVACYGRPVGEEVFETCVLVGRIIEACRSRGHDVRRIKRLAVKMAICHDSRAKDANIRQALIDMFGPGREKAIGTKAKPGPLYGLKADIWQALALAVTAAEKTE